MARTLGPVCRLCRREGIKLYLKGARCDGPKCAINKRNFPPGQHGLSRKKLSTYGQQLRQKQKAKRVYGVLERQFRRYFRMAERYRGVTGTTLLQVLERRLDNIVFRLGFAPSRKAARQMVGHGNVTVEGRKANIPSMLVKIGQKVSIREKLRENDGVRRSLEKIDREGRPSWLEYSAEDFSGRMLSIPSRQDIPTEVDEQMIVELYSK